MIYLLNSFGGIQSWSHAFWSSNFNKYQWEFSLVAVVSLLQYIFLCNFKMQYLVNNSVNNTCKSSPQNIFQQFRNERLIWTLIPSTAVHPFWLSLNWQTTSVVAFLGFDFFFTHSIRSVQFIFDKHCRDFGPENCGMFYLSQQDQVLWLTSFVSSVSLDVFWPSCKPPIPCLASSSWNNILKHL